MPGKTGVWVGERKVGAIGVRISQGVTSHGAALNVSVDLSRYRHIVPCGTPNKEVTSIHRQLAGAKWQPAAEQQQHQQQGETQQPAAGLPPLAAPSLQQVADCFLDAFCAHFGYSQLQLLPDVNALAAQLGGSGEAGPAGS